MKRKKEIKKALYRVKTDACEKIEILYNEDKSDFENNRKYRQEMVDIVDGLKAIQYSASPEAMAGLKTQRLAGGRAEISSP